MENFIGVIDYAFQKFEKWSPGGQNSDLSQTPYKSKPIHEPIKNWNECGRFTQKIIQEMSFSENCTNSKIALFQKSYFRWLENRVIEIGNSSSLQLISTI